MATTLTVVRAFGSYSVGSSITDPSLVSLYLNSPNVVKVQSGTSTTPAPTPTPTPTPAPTPTPTPSGATLNASNAAPLADGTATPGISLDYARADHVHSTDATRYAANNPLGFQTLAQVQGAVTSGIATVVGAAPAALDTLVEIAAKLGSDETAAAALTTLVGQHTAALATKGQAGGLAPLDANSKVPAANLPSGMGGTGLTSTTNTYTASGAIAVTDRWADVTSSNTLAMTLGAPTVDGQPLTVKRRGAGSFTLTLNLDDQPGTVLNSGTVNTQGKDVINLSGRLLPAPTWLLSA